MRIISGKYGKRRFDVPSNIKARPTTDFARENIFNVLSNNIEFEGLKALDLFAGTGAVSFEFASGTGAVSFEFASRGCSRVVSVENYPVQFKFIKKVAETLGANEIEVIRGDVFKFIPSCSEKFDIIFADPPYDMKNFDTIPSLILESDILNDGAVFIMEHPRNFDFSSLPYFSEHRVYGSVNFSIFVKG